MTSTRNEQCLLDRNYAYHTVIYHYDITNELIDGDIIEVYARCFGGCIYFELLTRSVDAVPLRIILAGKNLVTIQTIHQDQFITKDHPITDGIQPVKLFKLCIRAYQNRYEIFMNDVKVCEQASVVELENITKLMLHGQIGDPSIVFKNIYEEESNVDEADNVVNNICLAQSGQHHDPSSIAPIERTQPEDDGIKSNKVDANSSDTRASEIKAIGFSPNVSLKPRCITVR